MSQTDPYALVRGLINTWATYGEPAGHSGSDRAPLANEEDALKAIIGIAGIVHQAEKSGQISRATAQEASRLLLVVREHIRPFPEVFDGSQPPRDLARDEVKKSIASLRKS